MKKLLSFVTACALGFTACPVAFASEDVSVNSEVAINVGQDDIAEKKEKSTLTKVSDVVKTGAGKAVAWVGESASNAAIAVAGTVAIYASVVGIMNRSFFKDIWGNKNNTIFGKVWSTFKCLFVPQKSEAAAENKNATTAEPKKEESKKEEPKKEEPKKEEPKKESTK